MTEEELIAWILRAFNLGIKRGIIEGRKGDECFFDKDWDKIHDQLDSLKAEVCANMKE